MKLAGMASNRGRNLRNIADQAPGGAAFAVVLSNDEDAPILDAAAERGIPTEVVPKADDESRREHEQRVEAALAEYDFDLVAMDGYMRILTEDFVANQPTILNVHPSLLPAFPGAKAYRQAKEAGVRLAGVTAHYVTTDLDQGPIVAQRAFNVPDGASVETLKERGQPLEADVLLEAVRLHLNDDVSVHRGRTELRDDAAEVATKTTPEENGETDAAYQLGMPADLDRATPDGPTDERLVVPPQSDDD